MILESLAAEIHDTSTRASALILAGERLLATMAAVFALVGAFAVTGPRAYIFMALPFSIGVVAAYTLLLNNDIIVLGGYRAALEDEFAKRAGVPVFQWQSTVARNDHNRVQTIAVQLVFGIVFLASAVVAVAQALETRQPGAWGHELSALLIAATISSIVLVVAVIAACFVAQGRNLRKFETLVTERFNAG